MRGKRPYIQSALGLRKGKTWEDSNAEPLHVAIGSAVEQKTGDYEPKLYLGLWGLRSWSMDLSRPENSDQWKSGPHRWDGLRMKMP